ncbi:hypothetical protein EIN_498600 [Entamoeba invadens IP1]|uniref:Uncharacterized protein n=1 Tax=Entamoeba invadens IP1 TaxID=370355 RepID=A0A0A1UG98_ENTIV|nr:hypothetical protein EIN_498600 [Entamoeba invadens IP1]ELP94650.1 hypothetical protein EIN_498600 [Entamoeba invadens IP1]|eukprot:XP_004261421.1 hypothetical protein EIN_498600 [Entamoeba invadens IP1]
MPQDSESSEKSNKKTTRRTRKSDKAKKDKETVEKKPKKEVEHKSRKSTKRESTIEEYELQDVYQEIVPLTHQKKSILSEDYAQRIAVPPLNEDKLVKLPKGLITIELPEFQKVDEKDMSEESQKDDILSSDEETEDETYFKLHAEMESQERLRFIKVIQSLAPTTKHGVAEQQSVCDKYYTMTKTDELLPSYHSTIVLKQPINYLDCYEYNHCTNHVQPGVEKYIHPPSIPLLKGNWHVTIQGDSGSTLLIKKIE